MKQRLDFADQNSRRGFSNLSGHDFAIIPGIPLYTVQEVSRLANGNTLINNWVGSVPLADWPNVVQLIEVTPEKKVVWALRDWTVLGPASSTQLLDEPGVVEKREPQR